MNVYFHINVSIPIVLLRQNYDVLRGMRARPTRKLPGRVVKWHIR